MSFLLVPLSLKKAVLAAVDFDECCRIVNNRCELRKCVIRGGWVPGGSGSPFSYDRSTCPLFELWREVERPAPKQEGKECT